MTGTWFQGARDFWGARDLGFQDDRDLVQDYRGFVK